MVGEWAGAEVKAAKVDYGGLLVRRADCRWPTKRDDPCAPLYQPAAYFHPDTGHTFCRKHAIAWNLQHRNEPVQYIG